MVRSRFWEFQRSKKVWSEAQIWPAYQQHDLQFFFVHKIFLKIILYQIFLKCVFQERFLNIFIRNFFSLPSADKIREMKIVFFNEIHFEEKMQNHKSLKRKKKMFSMKSLRKKCRKNMYS